MHERPVSNGSGEPTRPCRCVDLSMEDVYQLAVALRSLILQLVWNGRCGILNILLDLALEVFRKNTLSNKLCATFPLCFSICNLFRLYPVTNALSRGRSLTWGCQERELEYSISARGTAQGQKKERPICVPHKIWLSSHAAFKSVATKAWGYFAGRHMRHRRRRRRSSRSFVKLGPEKAGLPHLPASPASSKGRTLARHLQQAEHCGPLHSDSPTDR